MSLRPPAADPEGRLAPRFFRLAALNILSNLMVPLAGIVDTAILGHLPDIRLPGRRRARAGLLFDYVYWTFGFLRMATTGLTAQAVGRGDDARESRLVLLRGLGPDLAGHRGIALLILQLPAAGAGVRCCCRGDRGGRGRRGAEYFDARIWGAPAALANFVLIGWFLGREQSGRALVLSVVGHGMNVTLDYLLIVRLGMEARGAGLATMASQYAMLGVGAVYVLRDLDAQRLRIGLRRARDRHAWTAMGALNVDILVRTFFLLTTFAVFTNLSAVLGIGVLAANAVLQKVVSLSAYCIDGFAFATESLAGILVGAGRRRALGRLLGLALAVGFVTSLAFAGLFLLFPEPLFGLLTDHPDVIADILALSGWLLPVLGIGSIAYVLDGYFLGLTRGRVLRWASVFSTCVGFAPAAWIAARAGSSDGLWLAMTLFMIARVISLGVCVPATLRRG